MVGLSFGSHKNDPKTWAEQLSQSSYHFWTIVYEKRDKGSLLKEVSSLEPTTFALATKYTKVTILGWSGTTEIAKIVGSKYRKSYT